VFGTGLEHSGRVRFHQKDLGPDGKDVRVWTISDPGDNSLLAEHCPASEPRASQGPTAQTTT
jgi:hypothetical protein